MNLPIRIELPTVFENMSVNSWLFLEPEPILIDCGEQTNQTWKALSDGLAQHNLAIQDIRKVIITHGHVDHMGMANRIAQNSDARILLNEYLYDWAVDLKTMLDRRSGAIDEIMRPLLPPHLLQNYFGFGYEILSPIWDEIDASRIDTFGINDKLTFGGDDWDVIYTPGHCINQTCFYNQNSGFLLSADMLLRMIPIPIIDAQLDSPYSPVPSLLMQLDSYKILQQLEIKKVFPGHFGSFENPGEVISIQVSKIHQRKEKCLELLQSGIKDIETLTNRIYPGRLNQATIFMVVGLIDILKAEGYTP